MSFFVWGAPKAWPRPKCRCIGRHATAYTPAGKHNIWRDKVRDEARVWWKKPASRDPLRVHCMFVFSRPKSHMGSGKFGWRLKNTSPRYHTAKPDIDNLYKTVLDGLTQAGVFTDDALVIGGTVSKRYALGEEKQGVHITIEEVKELA